MAAAESIDGEHRGARSHVSPKGREESAGPARSSSAATRAIMTTPSAIGHRRPRRRWRWAARRPAIPLGGEWASAAIPIIPLTIGLGAACSDTGLGPAVNLYGLMSGLPALVIWVAVVWRLYMVAGGDARYAERHPLVLFFGTLGGMVLEFPFSMASMEVYCQRSSWAGARNHLAVAALGALIVCGVVSADMRRKRAGGASGTAQVSARSRD